MSRPFSKSKQEPSRIDHQEYEKLIAHSLPSFSPEHRFFTKRKAHLLGQLFLPGSSVLDFGCGIGLTDAELSDYRFNLLGVDSDPQAIAEARKRNAWVQYFETSEFEFKENSFDHVFSICVFHHILSHERKATLQKIYRILKPGGSFVLIEHNPWNPLTRVAVSRCEFDKGVELLTGRESKDLLRSVGFSFQELRYFLFLPSMSSATLALERTISWIPLGAQYYIRGTKPATAAISDHKGDKKSETGF